MVINVAQLSGKVYPDRTISIGRVVAKKKRLEDAIYDNDWDDYNHVVKTVKWKYGRKKACLEIHTNPNVDLTKFINPEQSSQKQKRVYGKHGISKFGKKFVRNAALVFQKKVGKGRLGFGTATVPHLQPHEHDVLRKYWHDVVRKFYQKMRRHYKKNAEVFDYISVTEIQEKRLHRTGVPVPHLHFVYNCSASKYGKFSISADIVRKYWREVVNQVLAKRCEGFVFLTPDEFRASINLQRVKKSCANYLSKYLSKGGKCMDALIEKGVDVGVRQWWTASMQVKADFKEAVIRIAPDLCHQLFYNCGDFVEEGAITWLTYIYAEIKGGKDLCVGLSCKITQEFYSVFSPVIYC